VSCPLFTRSLKPYYKKGLSSDDRPALDNIDYNLDVRRTYEEIQKRVDSKEITEEAGVTLRGKPAPEGVRGRDRGSSSQGTEQEGEVTEPPEPSGESAPKTQPADYGTKNTLFTADAAAKAIETLKAKVSQTTSLSTMKSIGC
jgi:hypothetical protein